MQGLLAPHGCVFVSSVNAYLARSNGIFSAFSVNSMVVKTGDAGNPVNAWISFHCIKAQTF